MYSKLVKEARAEPDVGLGCVSGVVALAPPMTFLTYNPTICIHYLAATAECGHTRAAGAPSVWLEAVSIRKPEHMAEP